MIPVAMSTIPNVLVIYTTKTVKLSLLTCRHMNTLLPSSAQASQPIPRWGLILYPYYHNCGEPPYTLRHHTPYTQNSSFEVLQSFS